MSRSPASPNDSWQILNENKIGPAYAVWEVSSNSHTRSGSDSISQTRSFTLGSFVGISSKSSGPNFTILIYYTEQPQYSGINRFDQTNSKHELCWVQNRAGIVRIVYNIYISQIAEHAYIWLPIINLQLFCCTQKLRTEKFVLTSMYKLYNECSKNDSNFMVIMVCSNILITAI